MTDQPARHRVHPYILGSLIGAIGGTVFVLANRGQLPGPWPLLALIVWVLALAGYVWQVLLLPARLLPEAKRPRSRAGLIYLAAVVGMIVAIQVARAVLVGADREGLMPAAIVVAVGLHFVPFASAFRAPIFLQLGLLLSAIGTIGLVWGLTGDSAVPAAGAAVLAGLTMLVTMTLGARSGRATGPPPPHGAPLSAP